MRDPGSVESVGRLALLVVANRRERALDDGGVAPVWDERRHTAEGERPALVAGLDEEFGVRAHERDGHRDLAPIGENELLPIAELLDDAEHVVPAPGVEAPAV